MSNFEDKPVCIECKKGFFLSPSANDTNFGISDCIEHCIAQTNSLILTKLYFESQTSQLIRDKNNYCFTDDELPSQINDCFYYGPVLTFETSVTTFLNRCFLCHSYAFLVFSLVNNTSNGKFIKSCLLI